MADRTTLAGDGCSFGLTWVWLGFADGSWWTSAPVAPVARVSAAGVVFALVAALPLPVVGAGALPLPPLAAVAGGSLVFVFLCGEFVGAALALPLSVPVPLHLDWRAGARAFPLVTRPAAVTVASAGLGLTVAMVAGLGLEVGEEGRGWVSARRRAATVGARV